MKAEYMSNQIKKEMLIYYNVFHNTYHLAKGGITMYSKLSTRGMSNDEWLSLRKSGIGGSDAGAICGVNPYSSSVKVFIDKTSDKVSEIKVETKNK